MALELVNLLPYDHPYRWDGRAFGGPQLWRPLNLGSALAMWLDAEDTASITLNGSTVSQWNDKSGNARDVSQATAANQPTYTPNGLNGKPVLTFTGTNFLGRTNDTFLQNVPAASAFTVLSYADYATGARRSISINTTEGFGRMLAFGTGFAIQARGRRLTSDSFSVSNGAVVAATTPIIQGAQLDFAGNAITAVVNGVVAPAETFSSGAGNSESALVNIEMGTSISVQLFLGIMAETVLVNGVLSTTDRQKLEGYLAWKWGLEANLPAGHPFKNTPPTV